MDSRSEKNDMNTKRGPLEVVQWEVGGGRRAYD
jgi:hypothetical protein